MIEVCHGIEAFPQPSPGRNAGGDCFACALTAGLRWLFPEAAVSFDTVFECFEGEFYDPRAHENLENRIKALMGDAEVALSPHDDELIRWPTVSSTRVDVTALRAEHPEIAERFGKTTTTRRFEAL